MRSVVILLLLTLLPLAALAADNTVTFTQGDGRVSILIGGKDVATYVYNDAVVKRPYFCQVQTLAGGKVTRPYPPDPVVNKGNDDHETMHPGLWLAFGDINGVDFWRNKGMVRHVRFEGTFTEGPVGKFTVVNAYEPPKGGTPICEENCTYTVRPVTDGYLITSNSEFTSKQDFYFGDQEEMGYGARVNTPLTVEFGKGEIKNSEGGVNEEGTWGKQAKWCAYSGLIDSHRFGISLMPSPENFRPAWFHSRDYGLIVANPFGKKAMTAPDDKSVAPDKVGAAAAAKTYTFNLGFAAFIFDVPQDRQPDLNKAYDLYKGATGVHRD